MRNEHQKQEIINTFSDPRVVVDFLSDSDIQRLLRLFEEGHNKIYKTTGPVTLNLTPDLLGKNVFKRIFEKLHNEIGDFNFLSGFFFYVEDPHIIHNDDSFEFPQMYKGITLPLIIEYEDAPTEYPSLCFFDQYYLNGPSKFYNGGTNHPTHYNQQVTEYSEVIGCNAKGIDQDLIDKYLTHLRGEWLHGLSFDRAIESIPGRATIFDAVRLHCASDFKKQGIKSKLGISIFTKKD